MTAGGVAAGPLSGGRALALALATVLLGLCSLALMLAVDAAQATGRGVAELALGRAVASLTEVDSLAPAGLGELRAAAAAGEERLSVGDFPVRVELTPGEVSRYSVEDLRRTLVERSAKSLYEDGMTAFRSDSGSSDAGLFSVPGVVDGGLGTLGDNMHTALLWTVWALLAVWTLATAFIVAAARGYTRLTLVGAAVAAAAVPLLVLAVGVRYGLRVAADGTDDYISWQLLGLARDLSWVPVRNGIAFAGLGLGLLGLGLAGSWLEAGRRGAVR